MTGVVDLQEQIMAVVPSNGPRMNSTSRTTVVPRPNLPAEFLSRSRSPPLGPKDPSEDLRTKESMGGKRDYREALPQTTGRLPGDSSNLRLPGDYRESPGDYRESPGDYRETTGRVSGESGRGLWESLPVVSQ